eukprot:GHVS01039008.1.p1 GENE.GHVS01039008.1~~GHVS01039008.1.p1  ORF type:complete len:175 (+),score=27.40 GHVS01039008.1:73-597(+)
MMGKYNNNNMNRMQVLLCVIIALIQLSCCCSTAAGTNNGSTIHHYSPFPSIQQNKETTTSRRLLPPPLPFLPSWFNAETLWSAATYNNTLTTKLSKNKQTLGNITGEMLRVQEQKLTPLYQLIGKYRQQVSGVGDKAEDERLSQVRLQYELSSGIDVPGYSPELPDYSIVIPII